MHVVSLHWVHLVDGLPFAVRFMCASFSLHSTHTPLRHVSSQHSELLRQSVPTSLHCSTEQKLSMQLPEQHSAPTPHHSSSSLHLNEDSLSGPAPIGGTPPPPGVPPPGVVPFVWLVWFEPPVTQNPFVHVPEQQFEGTSHAELVGLHAQALFSQMIEQHSLLFVHDSPFCVHWVPEHVPLMQSPEGHCELEVQGPHVPLMHSSPDGH